MKNLQEKIFSNSCISCFSGFAYDILFLVSGFMTSWLFMKKINQLSKSESKVKMVLRTFLYRYIYTTILVGLVMLFFAAFFGKIGSGPIGVWNNETFLRGCRKWWHQLFYLTNIIVSLNSRAIFPVTYCDYPVKYNLYGSKIPYIQKFY